MKIKNAPMTAVQPYQKKMARKKYDFFSHGRGIPELVEYETKLLPQDVPQPSSPPPLEDSSYLHLKTYSDTTSSVPQLTSNNSDYNTSPRDFQTPLPYCNLPAPPSGYSRLPSFHYTGSSAFKETPAYSVSRLQISSPTPSSSHLIEDNVRGTARSHKRKRPQKCRMCANHQLQVEVKGHKWYCPFRECSCEKCEITRMTQFYMKERQKITRKQPVTQGENSSLVPSESVPVTRRTSCDSSLIDFPRRDELIRETANIIEDDLFEKINEACRPKSGLRGRDQPPHQ